MRGLVAWLLSPATSALAPILRVVLVAWLLGERVIGAGERLGKVLSARPTVALDAPVLDGLVTSLGLTLTPALLHDVADVALVAGICATVGLATRPALLVFAVTFMMLMGVQSGYGFFNHTPALPAQLVLALAVVPGSTSWSLDRVLLWLWRRRRSSSSPSSSSSSSLLQTLRPPTPRFGDVLVLLNVGVVYAAAGYAKLRYGAVEWLNGETLSFYLSTAAETQYWLRDEQQRIVAYSYMASPSALALRVSASTAWCVVLSWASLLLELLAPLLLMWRPWPRLAWCVSAIVFHSVIRSWMNIGFTAWIVVDAVIIAAVVIEGGPAIVAWLRRRGRPGPSGIHPQGMPPPRGGSGYGRARR